jgi:hypothetical protein
LRINCGTYLSLVFRSCEKDEWHEFLTSRKIQVAKLMLPNTPDKASFHDRALESVTRAKAAVVVAITVE